MIFGFSKPQKKEKIVAIFDIGSGSIGGAIVRIPNTNKSIPTIIKSVRTEIAYHDELDFNLFLKDMLVALKTTANGLYDAKLGAPDEIVCILASPWYLSETRIVKMSRDHSFVFTNNLADEMLQKEIASLNILYDKKYGEEEAKRILVSGEALKKFKEIVKAQGGDKSVSSEKVQLSDKKKKVVSKKSGKIHRINNFNLNSIAKILGAPDDKKAGIYLFKRFDELVVKGEPIMELYSSDSYKLKEALESSLYLPIYEIQ
jgi:AMP phosphorylase